MFVKKEIWNSVMANICLFADLIYVAVNFTGAKTKFTVVQSVNKHLIIERQAW